MRRFVLIVLFVGMLLAGAAFAQDWPQWRGPNRDGAAPSSPALIDGFDEKGPTKLWSVEIPGGANGGYGQVAVADGRAFVLYQHRYDAPIEERVLARNRLKQWGWEPGMPEDLVKVMETARASDERAALKDRKAINTWADAWIKTNEKDEWKRFRGAVKARLVAGADALPLEVLAKLAGIAGKPFAKQVAFDAWLKENGIDDAAKAKIMKGVPTTRRASDDYVYGIDTADGKIAWKFQAPGNWMWYPCSSTPSIRDGKCYVMGSTAIVYCLNAKDGSKLWQSEPLGGKHGHNRSSSVLLVDGKVIVSAETALNALDARTGKLVWSARDAVNKEASSVVWELGGMKYLLVAGRKKVHCIDPASGKTAWTVPGGDVGSTPVLAGNVMVFTGGHKDAGLIACELSAGAAEKVWNVPFMDRYASPVICKGHAYVVGGGNAIWGEKDKGKAVCVDLTTGKVAWEEVLGRGAELSSPIVADGKLIAVAAPWLFMIDTDPQGFKLLGKANLGLAIYTSPAIADGKLYVRTNREVVCYDLRKP